MRESDRRGNTSRKLYPVQLRRSAVQLMRSEGAIPGVSTVRVERSRIVNGEKRCSLSAGGPRSVSRRRRAVVKDAAQRIARKFQPDLGTYLSPVSDSSLPAESTPSLSLTLFFFLLCLFLIPPFADRSSISALPLDSVESNSHVLNVVEYLYQRSFSRHDDLNNWAGNRMTLLLNEIIAGDTELFKT